MSGDTLILAYSSHGKRAYIAVMEKRTYMIGMGIYMYSCHGKRSSVGIIGGAIWLSLEKVHQAYHGKMSLCA